MKGLKLSLVIMAAALLTIGLGGMAYAFHDGGVANCESCHTMHNSIGGLKVLKAGSQFTGVASLLKGSDPSSTCISCHSGATLSGKNVFTSTSINVQGAAPVNYTPGGDFAWLTKTTFGTSIPGERLGHNVVAGDFLLVADAVLKVAPGGTYKNTDLSCISCHDPHPKARVDSTYTIVYPTAGAVGVPIYKSGSYGDAPTATEAVGTYRLLGGKNYVPKSVGTPLFQYDPPVAVAPSTYNRMETSTDTRVAYGTGMSEWCANCHGSIHADSVSANFIHPASSAAGAQLGTTIAANYNMYKKSGDLSGSSVNSYTSLIPFEEGLGLSAANITTLKAYADPGNATSTTGPSGTENVMCLTCHRAHASGFKNITRWNNSEFITQAGVYSPPSGGMTTTEYQAAMYDRPTSMFATYQRSLCNKCHVKD